MRGFIIRIQQNYIKNSNTIFFNAEIKFDFSPLSKIDFRTEYGIYYILTIFFQLNYVVIIGFIINRLYR